MINKNASHFWPPFGRLLLDSGSGGLPPPFQTIPLSVIVTLMQRAYFINRLKAETKPVSASFLFDSAQIT